MEEHDWAGVQARCHALLRDTLAQINDLTGLPPAYPLDSDSFAMMGVGPIPAETDASWLNNRLYDQYQIEIPVVEWNGLKMVRISVQAYNTPEDLKTLVEALSLELPGVMQTQAVAAR